MREGYLMGMLSSFANPHRFLALSNWLAPLFYALAAMLIGWGLWQGLWMVPKDEYQGGDIMRVMFVHVPAAWLAMASYSAMAAASFWPRCGRLSAGRRSFVSFAACWSVEFRPRSKSGS